MSARDLGAELPYSDAPLTDAQKAELMERVRGLTRADLAEMVWRGARDLQAASAEVHELRDRIHRIRKHTRYTVEAAKRALRKLDRVRKACSLEVKKAQERAQQLEAELAELKSKVSP